MRRKPLINFPMTGRTLALTATIAALVAGMPWSGAAAQVAVEAKIEGSPVVVDVPRIGMNLGHWNYWGAEQLSRNILKNPGFEGVVDRALVRVSAASRGRFSDDQTWLARPDGFWSGATYEVLTGAATGLNGRIMDSRSAGSNRMPELISDETGAVLAVGDVVALTRMQDNALPTHWWLPSGVGGRVAVDPAQIAPGSPGKRSLSLTPLSGTTLRIASHLDTIGKRAGNLLPVTGQWKLAFWLRAEAGEPSPVRVLFRRHGSEPFIDLTLYPKPGWQQVEQVFESADNGPIGPLEFAIEVGGQGPVHLDDFWLGPVVGMSAGTNSGRDAAADAFRSEVIAALTQLRPGYLRDWQGQLGETLDNLLAEPLARRASRYRPGNSTDFGYSLPEFLALSRTVGANPWLVMPTTFSTDEARRLGAWLAERIRADGFQEVLVEFGNENWNSIFRPAGIQDAARHAAAANRLFVALREGAGHHPALRPVVNAQHANPYTAIKTAEAATQADILAVAPYLLHSLDETNQVQALEALFANDGGRLAEIAAGQPAAQDLAVYEVNLHTTRGTASASLRAAVTTGAASGPALAKRLIEAMALGARRQCVYTLAGFDTDLVDRSSLVPLFGVTRDLTRGDRFRPTGWAVSLLNQVIAGDLYQARITRGADPRLLIAPFKGPRGWSLAVVSSAQVPRQLTLTFPKDQTRKPDRARVLNASAPLIGNESADTIRPEPLALKRLATNRVQFTVPAYSLVVLGPKELLP